MKFFISLIVFITNIFANNFQDSDFIELKNINIKDYYVSEYIDGMSAIWNGKELYNNHKIKYDIDKKYLKNFPPFEIRGLLFCGTDYYDTYNDIILDKFKCTKFYTYDVPNKTGELKERLQILRDYLKKHPTENITFVEQHEFDNEKDFIDFFNTTTINGSEGVYLHKKGTTYDIPKEEKIIKIRKFYKDNCVISKVNIQNNKLSNYQCKWKKANAARAIDGDEERPENNEVIDISIGAGFTIEHMQNPLKIGDKIAFKYYKLNKNNIPVHCVFLRKF
ncbi:hypothetical protein [Campylobacter sp. MG1]|uniref:hypothetical protein n=1 Tax=Campylobacter sp. MG1 TaxID=2976332 RepID=UPI00226C9663|nr:hypothetical protein [Campylobacter sp. MG1]